jgi:MoaA/NifB/PqqE/SkfB family radical SAM enzyme
MIAERVAYRYAEIERKHRFRFLFDPLRLLTQAEFVRRYLAGENPFPLSVEIDPSNACNHDCGFCIYHALHQPGRSEHLPRDLLFSLVDQVRELGSTSVLFVGGGEPMTNPNTVEALERASTAGLSCGLVTNGSLVDAEKAGRLKKAATYVRFSLDAASPDTHLKLHRRGDFPAIVRNFTHLAQAAGQATVGTGYFIHQDNVQEIVSVARLVKDAGGDYIQFKTYSGIAFPAGLHERVLLEIERALALADAHFDIHVAERIFENWTFQVRGYTRCHFQAMKTVINADGLVYLCAQKRNSPDGAIGSVHESSLAEIWRGERRQRVVDSLQLVHCPYCVHDRQNRILEFLAHFRAPHRGFY